MQTFTGQMSPHNSGDSYDATVLIDGQWLRVMHGHRRLGAWALPDVTIERMTVFRFHMTFENVKHTFAPDDPAGFAQSVDIVVDLRPKTRFGLGDRVRKAKEELAAAHAASAD